MASQMYEVGDIVEYKGYNWRIKRMNPVRYEIERFLPHGWTQPASAKRDKVTLVQRASEDKAGEYKLLGLDISDSRAAAIAAKREEGDPESHREADEMSAEWELAESAHV